MRGMKRVLKCAAWGVGVLVAIVGLFLLLCVPCVIMTSLAAAAYRHACDAHSELRAQHPEQAQRILYKPFYYELLGGFYSVTASPEYDGEVLFVGALMGLDVYVKIEEINSPQAEYIGCFFKAEIVDGAEKDTPEPAPQAAPQDSH